MSFSGDADSFLTGLKLNSKHVLNTVMMKDWKTRLFIPQQIASIAGLSLGSGFQSLISGNSGLGTQSFTDSIGSFASNVGNLVNFVINSPFLILGVTKIQFSNEHVIPTTKGIGSSGEIIHLLGTRNEQITLTFTTERYPSLLGMFFREVISRTLERASTVYIIDEMTGVVPCILKDYNISKQADLPGAIQGELSFITLRQRGLSEANNVKSYMKTLFGKPRSALSTIKTTLPLGNQWLAPLAAAIGGATLGGGGLMAISNENTSYRNV